MANKRILADRPSEGAATRRPLRRDAEANRLRILEAAGTIFARRGLDVSMEDIAAAAGVGVGTLYRRFPDKQRLIDALFGQRLALMAQLATDSLEIDDPWEAVEFFMGRAVSMQTADRGLAELLQGRPGGREQVEHARATIEPLVDRLVARAHASGQLRHDITGADLAIIGIMISLLAQRLQPIAPQLWERYLAVVLDGLHITGIVPGRPSLSPIDPTIFHQLILPPPVP
jgi:AcrR family transcriptional regulator